MATRIGQWWRQDELERATKLREQGLSYSQIADVIGRSASGAQGALRGRVPKGAAIKNFDGGQWWTAEDDAKLRGAIVESGKIVLADLAALLGRSRDSIRRRIDRKHRGLTSRHTPQQVLPLVVPPPSPPTPKPNGSPRSDLSRNDWLAVGIRNGWLGVTLTKEDR